MIKTCVEVSKGKVIQAWHYSDQDARETYFSTKQEAEEYEKELAYWALKSNDAKAILRNKFQNDDLAWDTYTSVSQWAFKNNL